MNSKIEKIKERLEEMREELQERMDNLEEKAWDRESGEMTDSEQERYDRYQTNMEILDTVILELENWEA